MRADFGGGVRSNCCRMKAVINMGLLAALDYHATFQSQEGSVRNVIEYRLYSWGEIFPPFLGDREHSTAARLILRDYPFKLFSSSTPYDDPLPQKLTLSFVAPNESKIDMQNVKYGGIFPSEIASEFAAFLSVVTRRRIFIGMQTRVDGLPIEQKAHIYEKSHHQEAQPLKEINPSEIYILLENLRKLERRIRDAFILALRLYHTATQMLYTEPEFAYLFLVTCLETISSVVNRDYEPDDKFKYLESKFGGWKNWAAALSYVDLEGFADLLLRNEKYTLRKLSKFVQENVPDNFFSEIKDDAKLDFGTRSEIGTPSVSTLQSWEKIEKKDLQTVLRNIYKARSKLVHEGIRLPSSIVLGHFRMVPVEATIELFNSQTVQGDTRLEVPPLLTFERLVGYTLVNYLRNSNLAVEAGL